MTAKEGRFDRKLNKAVAYHVFAGKTVVLDMDSESNVDKAKAELAKFTGALALTFERKPDKGGETNHIGCIGIAAEGDGATVLLLRTGTDEARCKASGFLTKTVAPKEGTIYVAGKEEKKF